MSENLLSVENLVVEYDTQDGPARILTGLSFAIAKGESYGLVGESGSGKTTAALAIMRYLGGKGRIVSGSMMLGGIDIAALSESELRQIRGKRIAMVYQDPTGALNPTKTIGDQLVEVPIYSAGLSRRNGVERVRAALLEVQLKEVDRVMASYPFQLSGGQQQRAVIAMALLANPELLLLDEPTTGLDATVETEIVEMIRQVALRHDTALLYISHNLELIGRVCQRMGVLYAGELIEEGNTSELLMRPRHPYTRGLLNCLPRHGDRKTTRQLVPIPGQVVSARERPRGCNFFARCGYATAGICETPIPLERDADGRLIRCVRQHEIASAVEKAPAPIPSASTVPKETIIRVSGLSRQFTKRSFIVFGPRKITNANQDINIDIASGEILGLLGKSGSGKSTLAKIIAGLDKATAGSVHFGDLEISRLVAGKRPHTLLRSIQLVFQNPDRTLNPSHTVGYTLLRTIKCLGELPTLAERIERMNVLLDLVKLPAAIAQRYPRELSGGQRQRIAIARAFACRPAVVVCDEPVSALDVSVQAAIINLLLEAQQKFGTTLVFISHDLNLVHYLADRVVVMQHGKVVETGIADEVFADPKHPYTRTLLNAAHADFEAKKVSAPMK